jgi:hypothetical protein
VPMALDKRPALTEEAGRGRRAPALYGARWS